MLSGWSLSASRSLVVMPGGPSASPPPSAGSFSTVSSNPTLHPRAAFQAERRMLRPDHHRNGIAANLWVTVGPSNTLYALAEGVLRTPRSIHVGPNHRFSGRLSEVSSWPYSLAATRPRLKSTPIMGRYDIKSHICWVMERASPGLLRCVGEILSASFHALIRGI